MNNSCPPKTLPITPTTINNTINVDWSLIKQDLKLNSCFDISIQTINGYLIYQVQGSVNDFYITLNHIFVCRVFESKIVRFNQQLLTKFVNAINGC